MKRYFAILLLLCTSCPTRGGLRPLTDGRELRSPEGLQTASAVQMVSFEAGDEIYQFTAVLESSPSRFALVLFLPGGPRVLAAVWDGSRYMAERDPYIPLPAGPEEILRVYQETYWEDLRQSRSALEGRRQGKIGSTKVFIDSQLSN